MKPHNYDLKNLKQQIVKEVAQFSRVAAAEGLVLLKNNNVLPFDKSKTVSVFGRTQIDYVKSGTGSGGLVHTEYEVNIIDGLKNRININEELLGVYIDWIKENPFDNGPGWAQEPWAQKEMEVTDELCAAAAEKSDYALVIIGRTAGEDRDNFNGEGSYLLSVDEENLVQKVSAHFEKVCVALNTGNIIDMKWVDKYNVPCVLYCWQGGMEGGNSFADVILGDVSPSGKLPDTIAYDISDYPSTANFGNEKENIYAEDIYVGYRYFETFAKEKVMYPFGYGLSYTNFEYDYNTKIDNGKITLTAKVKNAGEYCGKSVVQIYFKAPQGRLGKPERQLVRYAKTKTLAPNEIQFLDITFSIDEMASYDDVETFSYILEEGEYTIYAGENVRDASPVCSVALEDKIVEKLRQTLAPVKSFKRMKPVVKDGKVVPVYDDSPIRQYDPEVRKKEHITEQDAPKGDMGIKFKDVAEGRNTMDEFVMQLSPEALSCLLKGEGMNSPKVRGGTAAAFGALNNELLSYGVPIACATDGPSGIRIDTGDKASLIPNGTCLSSTWNSELIEDLYQFLGIELLSNEVDVLLGPGTNIHRNPLNGRNFEYFSEDPYLSGTISAACTKGLAYVGATGTLKHFACNSQERNRFVLGAAVSERALREIYLKPYEIAVKTGNAKAIMTAYSILNGYHCPSNYELCTSILRDEWGYTGFVMTDWWAYVDSPNGSSKTNLKAMVEAQNDIYMATKSSEDYDDNLVESFENGTLDIAYLRKCAKNMLNFILNSPAINRKPREVQIIKREDFDKIFEIKDIAVNEHYDLTDADAVELEFTTNGAELAQYVISLHTGKEYIASALTQAAVKAPKTVLIPLPSENKNISFKFEAAFDYINLTGLKKI